MRGPRVVPLRQARRGEGDVYQVGVVRLPAWVVDEGEEEEVIRPWAGVAVSTTTGAIVTSGLARPGESSPKLALEAIARLEETGRRPAAIEVRDVGLAAFLRERLGPRGVRVEVCDRLVALDGGVRELGRSLEGPGEERIPPATSVPGVGVEHLRPFAEAMAELCAAAPWRFLDSGDAIRLETPAPDPVARWFSILGAAGEEFGLLGFDALSTLQSFLACEGSLSGFEGALWSVSGWEQVMVPFEELDLWADHGLPLVMEDLVPVAVLIGPKRRRRRASPRVLAFFEGVLRALAHSREADVCRGRWEKTVETSRGSVELAFSLPELLKVMQSPPPRRFGRFAGERILARDERAGATREFHSEEDLDAYIEAEVAREKREPLLASSDEEKAQELAWAALESSPPRSVMLARWALGLWPDCADAHAAFIATGRELAWDLERLREAVAAGERALGPRAFTEDSGRFWQLVRTRPYMRARKALAQVLYVAGEADEAAAHCLQLERLNPDDPLGVRHLLLLALVRLELFADARLLLERYKEEHLASWMYDRALVTCCLNDGSREARRHLRAAVKRNPIVPSYLLGEREMPDEVPEASPLGGEEEEAVAYAAEAREAWASQPRALGALRQARGQ